MSKETLKVFDTSLYRDLPESLRSNVLSEDLAGLVIEAGDRPLEERINPRLFRIVGNQVFDPKTGKSLEEEWSYTDELKRKESKAAESFYDYLLSKTSLVISISPSDGPAKYKEARINVGHRINEEWIEFYGIPSLLLPEDLKNYAVRLSEWNTEPISFRSPEDLRELAIPIDTPPGNPWEFLDMAAPLDSNAWKVILERRPWLIKQSAQQDADRVASEMSDRLAYAKSERDYIHVGAWGERMMQDSGWKLNTSDCPGLFNSQLLEKEFSYQPDFSILEKDSFGNTREVKWEYHKGDCVNCGKKDTQVGPCRICKECEKIL